VLGFPVDKGPELALAGRQQFPHLIQPGLNLAPVDDLAEVFRVRERGESQAVVTLDATVDLLPGASTGS